MYIPRLNLVTDEKTIADFIRNNSFGILISCEAGVPYATHLPLEYVAHESGAKFLYGHVARANPHWRLLENDIETLAIFSGPHAYVSAQWYDHMNVPTWNYMTAHVHGKARLISEEAEARAVLKRLVDSNEAATNPEAPYRMEALPEDYVAREMKALVVFEIAITRLAAKFKLSQNRDEKNFQNVIAKLRARDEVNAKLVAQEMESLGPKLFPQH